MFILGNDYDDPDGAELSNDLDVNEVNTISSSGTKYQWNRRS